MAAPELKIKTVINRLHPVFDRSGRLPFSIVFGICRLSSDASPDEDPRPMLLPLKGSILDVPHALSKGLLTLWVHHGQEDRQWEVDVSQLDLSTGNEEAYLTLPSPVGREGTWKSNLAVYRYPVDPDSDFGRLFEEGKTYTIRGKTGIDLGFEDWTYLDDDKSLKTEHQETEPSIPKPRLVAARADGRALFNVVSSIPIPPALETKMKLCKSDEEGESVYIEVRTLNLGAETIVAQTRGRQHFLVPWGPMQPQDDISGLDTRPRLIDSEASSALPAFQVVDKATKKVVREASKPGVCGLYGRHDPRPRLETLVTLKPNGTIIRYVDPTKLLSKLPDGQYNLRMEPMGMWWCYGSVEEFAAEGEERVPHRLWTIVTSPLMLECEDALEVQVENGVGRL